MTLRRKTRLLGIMQNSRLARTYRSSSREGFSYISLHRHSPHELSSSIGVREIKAKQSRTQYFQSQPIYSSGLFRRRYKEPPCSWMVICLLTSRVNAGCHPAIVPRPKDHLILEECVGETLYSLCWLHGPWKTKR